MAENRRPFTYNNYIIKWICVLIKFKLVVLRAILDKKHLLLLVADLGDTNVYLLGRIGSYNVVIACLLAETTSIISATIVAKDIICSFFMIGFGLMVSIIGKVLGFSFNSKIDNDKDKSLSDRKDIRLGDVVVNLHLKDFNTII